MNTQEALESASTVVPEKPPLNLQVDVQEKSACERHVTVSIPREDIERYFKVQFDELVPKAEVPGFRPGRAPRQFVENRFRKQVAEQVKGSLIMDSLAQISSGEYFSAISEPDLAYDKIDVPDDGPMTFEFNIEVRPEFEMPEWKGIQLQKPVREFGEAWISDRLQQMRYRKGTLVPVDLPIEAQDVVTLKVTSRLGDKVVSSQEELTIPVQSKASFTDTEIVDFDKLMLGAQVGDVRKTTVQLSEFAENPELQSQTLDVEFEVAEIKRVEPQSESELIESLGFESIEALKTQFETTFRSREVYEQHQAFREQIARHLTQSANWELPPDLLRRQFRREMNRSAMELESSGFTNEEVQIRLNELRHDILNRTELLLKEHFILERIAEVEKIEDSPADYEIEFARMAMSTGESVRRVRARMERAGQMDVLRNMIIEQKVIRLIESHAQIETMPAQVTPEEDVAAVDFAFGGRHQESIPEAKYEDPQAAPIPGSIPAKPV